MVGSKKKSSRVRGHVSRSEGLESPKSSRSPNAYYSKTKHGHCRKGTHVAKGYRKFKDPKKFCVRDCDAWSPARSEGKRGRCVRHLPKKGEKDYKPRKPSAWMAVLTDVRAANKAYTDTLTGVDKKNAMIDVMLAAQKVYAEYFVKGKSTYADYKRISKTEDYDIAVEQAEE